MREEEAWREVRAELWSRRRRVQMGDGGHALEVSCKEAAHVVVGAHAFDGSLGLGISVDLRRLKPGLAPPELGVVVLLVVNRDLKSPSKDWPMWPCGATTFACPWRAAAGAGRAAPTARG